MKYEPFAPTLPACMAITQTLPYTIDRTAPSRLNLGSWNVARWPTSGDGKGEDVERGEGVERAISLDRIVAVARPIASRLGTTGERLDLGIAGIDQWTPWADMPAHPCGVPGAWLEQAARIATTAIRKRSARTFGP